MTEQQTLLRVHTPITSHYTEKQVLIFFVSALVCISLAQWSLNHRENPGILGIGISSIVFILGLVWLCARNEVALYKSSIWIGFHIRYITGADKIYKYDKNTTPRMIRQFTKIIGMSKKGGIKFQKCQTYDKNACNRGFVYLVNPASIQDYGAFVANMKRLYNSLPPGAEHKEILAQSKQLTNLAEKYEKALENKDLPVMIREGLYSIKLFFDDVKDRVGWLFIIFIGPGYIVNDEQAETRILEISETCGKFLQLSGVKYVLIKDGFTYSIIYKQLFTMKNIMGALK
jgi:hypothetical protein